MDVNAKTQRENEERIAEDYLSSLSDLNCNSKPLINMLTMLAEENIEYASVIVKVVEQQITKVQSEFKLPILYLIDSIVKNVKSAYVQLFSQCIVNIFCDVFEKVNEKVRERMYALRQTWNEVFTPQKLYALDIKVKRMDNNWPITAKQPQPSIHVNPNFLKNVGTTQAIPSDMEEILHAKTRELLELKKRKLELELEATKKHLEEQEKQLSKATESVMVAPNEVLNEMHLDIRAPQAPVVAAAGSNLNQLHGAATNNAHTGVMFPNKFPNMSQHQHQHQHLMPPRLITVPAIQQGFTQLPKAKVHPVNPSLLSTVRQRDPRLVRQQQQHNQHPHQYHDGHGGSTAHSVRSSSVEYSHSKSDSGGGKTTLSGASSRGHSKSSRAGSADNKSPSKHSSSSNSSATSSSGRSLERVRKNSSSQRDRDDRDKERKRGESKSSSSSSSASSSYANERRKDRSSRDKDYTIKCDKDAFEIAPLKRKSSPCSGSGSSPSKSKDVKRSPKMSDRNHRGHRKNRSRSPTPPPLPPSKKSTTDVDLRVFPPPTASVSDVLVSVSTSPSSALDKRYKQTTTVAAATAVVAAAVTAAASVSAAVAAATIVSEGEKDNIIKEETNSASTARDLDKTSNSNSNCTSNSNSTAFAQITPKKGDKTPTSASTQSSESGDKKDHNVDDNSSSSASNTRQYVAEEQLSLHPNAISDGKKRPSVGVDEDQPVAKRNKSAKLDALFGSEDVDLRTALPAPVPAPQRHSYSPPLSPPTFLKTNSADDANGQLGTESWDNLKMSRVGQNVGMQQSPKKGSTLDDVRAKLAKAAKYNKSGRATDHISKEVTQRLRLADLNVNEDSLEANDEKIRTIITQAQELLEAKSINQEQYKNLVQTVMSINETNKLKEAKRRESLNAFKMGGKEPMYDDENSMEADRKAARDAVLKKRIPKLTKEQMDLNENKTLVDDTTASNSPLYDDKSDFPEGNKTVPPNRMNKKRSKSAKWSDKIDTSSSGGGGSGVNNAFPQRPWLAGGAAAVKQQQRGFGGSGFRGLSVPQPPMPPQQQNPNMRLSQLPWQMGNNNVTAPFVNPIHLLHQSSVPPPPQPPNALNMPVIPNAPNLPKPCNSIDNPQADLVRSITIDGLTKEIRIYDKVAIVFMDQDQPREIGFQAGQRSIIIDNEDAIPLQFNDNYKPVTINGGEVHMVRFGFPSRELYIDEHWYEIYFGGPPVSIPIKNKMHILKAEGPPPQVNIGPLRRDLVAGKINMIVDAHIVVPLFLDAKVQTFFLGDEQHTVQFADQLLTVLLDGEPITVEYGGLPKNLPLGAKKYFIRFGALPKGITAGNVHIEDMIYVKTEPKDESNLQQSILTMDVATSSTTTKDISEKDVAVKMEVDPLAVNVETATANSNATASLIPIIPAAALNNINIDELFQKLVSAGILGNSSVVKPVAANNNSSSGSQNKSSNGNSSSRSTVIKPSASDATQTEQSTAAAATSAKEKELEHIHDIDLRKTESIKTRQQGIINRLYCGMQCGSCGVRFPPEQTIKYSQHLDWHFRQNRRERDSTRKAHSRKWYYDLADWVQYEEIEDLDEREKNFFETQQNEMELTDETSNQQAMNSPAPSCAAGADNVDRHCDMCNEKFEQFYNEDLEEWHLRSALQVDDKFYHPLCYEDYKASLNVKKQDPELANAEDDNAVDMLIKTEEAAEKKEDNKKIDCSLLTIDDDEDDDDDVIVLPAEEPSVTEIVDDEDDNEIPSTDGKPNEEEVTVVIDAEANISIENSDNAGGDSGNALNDTMESDVEIQEPHIPFTDLDTYEEKAPLETEDAAMLPIGAVKIKEEPRDDDEDEDDGFEDVGTVLLIPAEEISLNSEDTQTQTILSSNSAASPGTERPTSAASNGDSTENPETVNELHMSMDGNVEPESEHNLSSSAPAPAISLASLVNKIKINITKTTATTSVASTTTMQTSTTASATATTAAMPSTPTTNNNNNSTNGGNVKANPIPTISTIPVLCGGGIMSAPTISTTHSNNSGGSNERNDSIVSSISVIGSYNNNNNSSSSGNNNGPPNTSRYQSHNKHTVAPVKRASPPPPPVEDTITFELKPSLQNVTLQKMKKVQCGTETSGLCSIM